MADIPNLAGVATAEQAGALCALIQEDVQITLIPPTKQAKGSKPQQEDLAA